MSDIAFRVDELNAVFDPRGGGDNGWVFDLPQLRRLQMRLVAAPAAHIRRCVRLLILGADCFAKYRRSSQQSAVHDPDSLMF